MGILGSYSLLFAAKSHSYPACGRGWIENLNLMTESILVPMKTMGHYGKQGYKTTNDH